MRAVEIKKDIYWVGGVDWNIREFHGYKTPRGTSYNAYLIIDEKVTLVDTVKSYLSEELIDRISQIIDVENIDYVVCNHVEMDHSGAIPEIMKRAKNATIVTNMVGKKGLEEHFETEGWNFEIIKNKQELSLGKKTLQFITTPMLHWPDSMMTYVKEDKLLLPNDGFGQHMAPSDVYAKNNGLDTVLSEAKKYFANILYPFCNQANKAFKGLEGLDIDMIAPSHGCIWKGEEEVAKILSAYQEWVAQEGKEKAVVVYDLMYGATEKLATAVKSEFEDNGIEVTYRCLSVDDMSDVIVDFIDSKYIAIGSPTLNKNIFPRVAAFVTYMKGLNPKNKIGFTFGSFGWEKGALDAIQSVMQELEWKTPLEPFEVKYTPRCNAVDEIKEQIKQIVQSQKDEKIEKKAS